MTVALIACWQVGGQTGCGRVVFPLPVAGGNHGFNPNETVCDLLVLAKAIGISEADLQTALDGDQTVAAVARAHNVAAQAEAQKAEVTQRATDQVNGTMTGGPMGGPGGSGH